MFDAGFSEIIFIAIIALIVFGPERLPKVARVAGMWVGRARRSLTAVKAEIERELRTQELNELLERQRRSDPLETILDEGPSAAADHARGQNPEPHVSGTARPPGE